jgi:hypothetical protein
VGSSGDRLPGLPRQTARRSLTAGEKWRGTVPLHRTAPHAGERSCRACRVAPERYARTRPRLSLLSIGMCSQRCPRPRSSWRATFGVARSRDITGDGEGRASWAALRSPRRSATAPHTARPSPSSGPRRAGGSAAADPGRLALIAAPAGASGRTAARRSRTIAARTDQRLHRQPCHADNISSRRRALRTRRLDHIRGRDLARD